MVFVAAHSFAKSYPMCLVHVVCFQVMEATDGADFLTGAGTLESIPATVIALENGH